MGSQPVMHPSMPPDSAVLSIDECFIFLNNGELGVILSLENDVDVCAIQTDILFDTTCFTVTAIRKTIRSRDMDIFQYGDIEGGIRIAITSLGGSIRPATGPIVDIRTRLENCEESSSLWDITNPIVADPLGGNLHVEEGDGYVTVLFSPRGDINADGRVNVLDVVLAVRMAIGSYPDPTEEELWAADCILDGVIDVADVLRIVDWITGYGECPE